jgi:predicted PurR-regulated permease PerM
MNTAPSGQRTARARKLSYGALVAMVCVGVVLCALIAAPFLSALTWAFALAVLAGPFHQRLEGKLGRPGLAALLSVLILTLVILIPTGVIVWLVGVQANQGFQRIQEEISAGSIRDMASHLPGGARLYDALMSGEATGTSLGPAVQQTAGAWLSAATAALLQMAVALFALFFLLRDRAAVLGAVRHYLPLSAREADQVFTRVRAITHATLYGTFVCAAIQGVLGGLMFWFLGIPGTLLWAVAMAMLSLIPSSGAFFIWLPAAVILAFQGDWTRAAILAGWGVLVVGTIDNLLYPHLVGKEMHLHTLTVFLAVVGGLFVFGAAGLVLGPVIVAATMAMHEILRARTSHARSQ